MAKTMVFRMVNDVVICVHNSKPPAEEDFDAYIEFCRTLPKTCTRYIIFTPGPGPNAAQRKQTTDTIRVRGDKNVQVAVVTDATVVRGIVTALSWFSTGIRAFSPANVREAFAYLKVSDVQAGQIMLEARKLQADVQ